MVLTRAISAVISKISTGERRPSRSSAITEGTPRIAWDKDKSTDASATRFDCSSPQAKIHDRIWHRRAGSVENPTMNNLSIDCLNYSDTCDQLPYDMKNSAINNLKSDDITLVESNTSQMNEILERNSRVKQYLNEQNSKFNELINKNLNVVLNQQSKFSERAEMFDRSPTSGSKSDTNVQFDFLDELNSLNHSSRLHSKDQGIFQKGGLDELSFKGMGQFDPNLQTENDIDQFISSLDDETKSRLLDVLQEDLKLRDIVAFKAVVADSDSVVDKLEALIILSIKLCFLGCKFVTPIIIWSYDKFSNNRFPVVNSKNLSWMLSFTIRQLTFLELSLQHEKAEKTVSTPSSKDFNVPNNSQRKNFGGLYSTLDSKLNAWIADDSEAANSKNWKSALFLNVLSSLLDLRVPGSSQHKKNNGQHEEPGHSSSDDSYVARKDTFPLPSTSRSSSQSFENLSMLQIAEKFVREIGP